MLLLLPMFATGQIITTIAGNGINGYAGDDGLATSAEIGIIGAIATDGLGNLYFSDATHEKIRKVNLSTGIIKKIAGNGIQGFNGDGGPADSAQLNMELGGWIAVDSIGNIYISDSHNNRIRKVDAITSTINTIAGNGTWHHYGDGWPAVGASFGSVQTLAVDHNGNLYISDSSCWIRKVSPSGIITTVAGIGILGSTGDNGLATSAQIYCAGIACDKQGNIYFSGDARIRRIDVVSGIITTVAGNGNASCYPNDSLLTALDACTGAVELVLDAYGHVFFSQPSATYSRVRKIDSWDIIQPVAGYGSNGFSGDEGMAASAQLSYPRGLAFDTCGNLLIADMQNKRIRKIALNPACLPEKVSKIIATNALNIYPNPATTTLSITSPDKITQITITNLLGQAVYTQTCNTEQVQVNVASFPAGMYFVKVNDNVVRKFVRE